MNEELPEGLRAWLREWDDRAPDPDGSIDRLMVEARRSPQAGRWWPPTRSGGTPSGRFGSSSLTFIVAAGLVALIGGTLSMARVSPEPSDAAMAVLVPSPSTGDAPGGTEAPDRSVVDEFADRADELVRGLFAGELVPPTQEPLVAETYRHADLSLVVERLDSGALRVIDDGVLGHGLERGLTDVAASPDGDIWVMSRRHLFRLGELGLVHAVEGSVRHLDHLDVGPDGSVSLRVLRSRGLDWRQLALVDDERLEVLPLVGLDGGRRGLQGTTIGYDGTPWATVEGSVAHFDGTTWKEHPADDVFPIAMSDRLQRGDDRWIHLPHIVSTADGSVWVAFDESVSRFTGGTWREFRPLASVDPGGKGRIETLAIADGPDGTIWAALSRGRREYLVRFDGEWAVFPLDDVRPRARLVAHELAVDATGAVLVAVGDRYANGGPDDPPVVILSFDGVEVTERATLPTDELGRIERLAWASDGSIWAIGGPAGRTTQRLHLLPAAAVGSRS